MKKALTNKAVVLLLLTIIIISILPVISFAQSQNIQMIKKSDNEYMIYVSGLWDQEFKFAFSNEKDATIDASSFKDAALDKLENGNYIAYIDSALYTQYFNGKDSTYLWVKQGETYKLKAKKVELSEALTEEDIQAFNTVTKMIEVKVGTKELPTETVDGVEISHKIGTIHITDDQTAKYAYKMIKSTEGSQAEKLIELAKKMNTLNDTNVFEQLSTYNEFKKVFTDLMPKVDDTKWTEVNNNTIEQPQDSKKGDQYLVWIKQESAQMPIIDVQIMICNEDYIPEYEKQEIVIKETTKLPITADNVVLFVIAGVILALIVAVVILKVSNKSEKK